MNDLPPGAAEAEELLRRRRARRGMLAFVEYTHPNWSTGEHHSLMCEKLDNLERGIITRLLMNAPPRHSKTQLCSRSFPAYYLGKHPDHQIIISSYSDDLAGDISRDIRNILNDPYYQALCEHPDFAGGGTPGEVERFGEEKLEFPGASPSSETTAGFRWETTKGGIVVARGIGGGITGRGADLLIIDDPLKDREDADSVRMRERCWSWFHGTATDRLMPGGKILVMQTRWHEDDLAGKLMDSEDEETEDEDRWVQLVMPAILNEGTKKERALWPGGSEKDGPNKEWFPLGKLKKKKREKTKAGKLRDWNAQYMQKPTAEEGLYIKREYFRERYDKAPDLVRPYMASDLAVTSKEASRFADWTIHIVGGIGEDGRLYILDCWRRRSSPDEWIDSMLALVKQHKPVHWAGEAGVIRRSVEGLINKRCMETKTFFDQKWISPTADKQTRATTFKGWASMGRIVFPKTAWAEEIIEICVGFPTIRNDDAFDAMSTLCLSLDEAVAPVAPRRKPKPKDDWESMVPAPDDRWRTL